MATDEVNFTQETLDLLTSYIANNVLNYLTTGTGSAGTTLTSEDLESPVDIQAGIRNLLPLTITTNGNFFRLKFRLTSAMPQSLPVDLQEFGMMQTSTATSGMVFGWTQPVANTKDNQSQWDLTLSGRVVEIEEEEVL